MFQSSCFRTNPFRIEYQLYIFTICLNHLVFIASLYDWPRHHLGFRSAQDLTDLLAPAEFAAFVEASFKHLVDSCADFVRCPACNTPAAVPEPVDDDDALVQASAAEYAALANATGIEGSGAEPLSHAAKLHYLRHRAKCVGGGCHIDFCRQCSATPYHAGFASCEAHQAFLRAPKCTYCRMALDEDAESSSSSSSDSSAHVCKAAACAAKFAASCGKRLPGCGHACAGHRGETSCPPCLLESCEAGAAQRAAALPAAVTQCASDECAICCTDELGGAPVVLLPACGHILHFECLKTRLEGAWSGATIDFAFRNCPLCARHIGAADIPALSEVLEKQDALRQRVAVRALERLKFEGGDRSKALTDRKSPYYRDPRALAMHTYVFFQCHQCKNPYFGGARQCGAGQDEQREIKKEVCFEEDQE